jgi:hypothetical protein
MRIGRGRRAPRVGWVFRVVLPGQIELIKGPETDGMWAGLEAAPEELLLGLCGRGRQDNQDGGESPHRLE